MSNSDLPVLYTEAVEGFFQRGLGAKLSAKAKAELKQAGLDLQDKLKPTYPLESYRRFVQIARVDLYPNLSRAEAERLLGAVTVTGYAETIVGRTVFALFRLLGIERSLTKVDANIRGVNNFTRTRITRIAPGEADYWFNELSVSSDYTIGLLEAGLRAMGAGDSSVEYLRDAEPHTFRLRWKAR